MSLAAWSGFFLKSIFVTARAERGGGCVAQALNGAGFLLVDIDQVFVEYAEDAVGAAVDFLDAIVPAGFLDDARQARVDHGGRSARLRHQKVS
jgi:hypothetical protein